MLYKMAESLKKLSEAELEQLIEDSWKMRNPYKREIYQELIYNRWAEISLRNALESSGENHNSSTIEIVQNWCAATPDSYRQIFDHFKGLKNHVVPIQIFHQSLGDTNGKTSWHRNREALIHHLGDKLPVILT